MKAILVLICLFLIGCREVNYYPGSIIQIDRGIDTSLHGASRVSGIVYRDPFATTADDSWASVWRPCCNDTVKVDSTGRFRLMCASGKTELCFGNTLDEKNHICIDTLNLRPNEYVDLEVRLSITEE